MELNFVSAVDDTKADKNEIFMNGVKRRAVNPPTVETVTGHNQEYNPPIPVVRQTQVTAPRDISR